MAVLRNGLLMYVCLAAWRGPLAAGRNHSCQSPFLQARFPMSQPTSQSRDLEYGEESDPLVTPTSQSYEPPVASVRFVLPFTL